MPGKARRRIALRRRTALRAHRCSGASAAQTKARRGELA
eukprot:CAMPEP_0171203742 /NCGR_PEP_ID=MMETSP0790-20130122/25678_1 /TAXON_ID=2925 /ORGANISM="Alexandrium catenella, Strain OF101" /LENGTH=38 /DNA_ID= /DNA_START= /DNA_END= /DNA_ORIENTATION=